jgi:hypothetical protein
MNTLDSKISILAVSVSLTVAVIYDFAWRPAASQPQNQTATKVPVANPGQPNNNRPGQDANYWRAQSGVKLLLGIFNRLGNEPQIALKNESLANRPLAPSQFNANIHNNTDPALTIRPQTARRINLNGTVINKTTPIEVNAGNNAVALLPPASEKPDLAQAPPVQSETLGSQGNIQTWSQARTAQAVAESSNIRDYSRQEKGREKESEPKQQDGGTVSGITSIIRPSEQPGLYKYIYEHKKIAPMPPPASTSTSKDAVLEFKRQPPTKPATISVSRAKAKKRADNEITIESDEGSPIQVAFLPPSAVHGLSGLSLGASEKETTLYLKDRGPLSSTTYGGFKVWTLTDKSGKPHLQVYLRNNRAEAFRVFDPKYVPASLGINISDNLAAMKQKFGEPSFILEEPNVKNAKNYVYPVSQISFQLARPLQDKGKSQIQSKPQILSLMLFRFL